MSYELDFKYALFSIENDIVRAIYHARVTDDIQAQTHFSFAIISTSDLLEKEFGVFHLFEVGLGEDRVRVQFSASQLSLSIGFQVTLPNSRKCHFRIHRDTQYVVFMRNESTKEVSCVGVQPEFAVVRHLFGNYLIPDTALSSMCEKYAITEETKVENETMSCDIDFSENPILFPFCCMDNNVVIHNDNGEDNLFCGLYTLNCNFPQGMFTLHADESAKHEILAAYNEEELKIEIKDRGAIERRVSIPFDTCNKYLLVIHAKNYGLTYISAVSASGRHNELVTSFTLGKEERDGIFQNLRDKLAAFNEQEEKQKTFDAPDGHTIRSFQCLPSGLKTYVYDTEKYNALVINNEAIQVNYLELKRSSASIQTRFQRNSMAWECFGMYGTAVADDLFIWPSNLCTKGDFPTAIPANMIGMFREVFAPDAQCPLLTCKESPALSKVSYKGNDIFILNTLDMVNGPDLRRFNNNRVQAFFSLGGLNVVFSPADLKLSTRHIWIPNDVYPVIVWENGVIEHIAVLPQRIYSTIGEIVSDKIWDAD